MSYIAHSFHCRMCPRGKRTISSIRNIYIYIYLWDPPSRKGEFMERGDWARLWLIKGLQGAKWPVVERQPSWVFCPFTGLCDKKVWLDGKLCGTWFEFTWLSIPSNQKLISPFESSLSLLLWPHAYVNYSRACFGGYHAPRKDCGLFFKSLLLKTLEICLPTLHWIFQKLIGQGVLSMVITGNAFCSLPVPLSLVDLGAMFTWQRRGSQEDMKRTFLI